MDNFGIRQGTVVNNHKDILQAANTFDPFNFLSAIQDFARFPHMKHDLEITVACAQASASLTFRGLVFSGKHKHKVEEKHLRETKKRKINDLIAELEPSKEAEEDMSDCDEILLDIAGVKFPKGIRANRQKCQRSDPTSKKSGGDAIASMMAKILKKTTSDAEKSIEEGSIQRSESPNVHPKDLKSNKESNSMSPGFGPGVKRTFKSFKSGEFTRKVASDMAPRPTYSKSSSAANGQEKFEHGSKSPKKVDMDISSSWSTQRGTTRSI